MSLNPRITTDTPTKVMNVQILFLDTFVDNIEILLKGTFSGIETIILSAQEDGVTQITELLKQRQNVETVHIVSHGAPGFLYLGNSELSLNTLKDYASQLQECSRENLNLLLYGCNVAAGDAGEEFLNKLHSLTGANIAASATKTGNAALGGDWNLEVTVGEIVPQLAFNHQAIANYASILAPTVSFNVSSVFDTDVIVNRTGGVTDTTQTAIDLTNNALITQSFATFGNSTSGNGLPDNGFFAATSFNPDIQLSYRNTDNGNNARLIKTSTGSFTFNVSGQYAYVHLALTSTEGNSNVRLTLNYSDGTTETTNSLEIPDWYNEITPSNTLYYLSNGLDRSKTDGTGFEDANNPAVFGVRFSANAAKTLQSITVEKTASTGYLVFFGATGELTNAPALTGTAATLNNGTEDTAYTISAANLLQGFTDVDGDTLSVSNLTATNGTVINNGNGTYTFNPNANYNGTVSLSYNVIDGKGGSTPATRSFSLAAINDAPALTGTAAILNNGTEDTAYTISAANLLQGFTDVDGDTLSLANLTATNGTVVNNGNGTYTFNPNANYNGTVSLSYNVTDGKGGSTAATRSFSLAAINDAPALTGTAAILNNGTEDTAYTISATSLLQGFTDVDGDTLSLANLTATNGTVVNNGNGTYTFNPNANYNGTVSLSYNVIDGKGGSTAATRSFSLVPVNDAPTPTVSFNVLSVFDTDVIVNRTGGVTDTAQTAIDLTNYALITQSFATFGNSTSGNGLPDDGFFAATSFNPDIQLSYRNTDNGNNARLIKTSTGTFTFNVSGQYAYVHLALTSTEGSSDVRLTLNYSDGTTETTNSQTIPDWYNEITPSNTLYYLSNGLDRSKTDGTGFEDANNPAVFGVRFSANAAKTLQSITVEKTASTGYLVFLGATGELTNAPALNNGTEDTPYTISATSLLQGFTDIDGDTLSVANLTATNGAVINNGNGTYTFNPNANYNGTVSLSYNVIDGKGGSTPATSTFSLAAVNDAPALTGTAAILNNGTEDTAYTISATSLLQGFTDVDGDTLSVSGLTATNGTVVNNGNGTYTFNPNANYNGTVSLSYNVIDGKGGSTLATSTFSLTAVNDAPALTGTAAILNNGTEDTAYTISATSLLQGFTDVDGDTLSVSGLTATNGTVVNNGNGTYTFNPNANYNGTVSLSYNVIDGKGGTTPATSTFSLTAVNDAPALTGTAAILSNGIEDTAYTISATSLLQGFTDVDGDTLSISNLTASNGSVADNGNGTYTFNPNANYNGLVTLNYNVTDGNGGATASTSTFSLTAINDAPTLTETPTGLSNGRKDTPYTISAISLLEGFTDVDGDTLSVSNLTASNGSLADNANGTYTFNPNANYDGLVTLNYNVTDGNGGTTAATSTFSVTEVTEVNEAPVLGAAASGSLAYTENAAATKISATGLKITDVDNSDISSATISITGNYQKGQDILSVFGTLPTDITASAFDTTTGTITLTGSATRANYTTALAQIAYSNSSENPNTNARTVSFTVNDGAANSNTVTRTINVTPVNDAPSLTGTPATLNNGVENTAYTISATSLLEGFTDVEGDTLSVSKLSASNGSVTDNGNGTYTFKPNPNYNGLVTLNYNVIDGNGGSTAAGGIFSLAAVNDAPVLGAAASGSLVYKENAAATKISATGLKITDVDNSDISSATISITGNYQKGQDILSILGTLPTEITASAFDTTTGTITLTGNATLATYTTALAQIAYSNSSENPNTNARTVSFTVNDGAANSNTVTRTINVTPVNDAPVLGAAASGSLAYIENAAATLISSTGLEIIDVDNTNITSATISITGNYQKGQDILSILGTLPTGIIAGAFNVSTGTITLTGSATLANYTTALAQIAYSNTSESPNTNVRTVSFTVYNDKTNSNAVTRTINVTPVNDAPVLGAATSGSLAYIENAAATKISFSGLEIIDADNTNISSATISITGNYQKGQDILSVIGTLPVGITASGFDTTTGTITLSGSATRANYKTALAQIAYSNTSENPNTNARTVSFRVNDGAANSNAVTRTINVTPVNDAPVLGAAASGSLTYTENAAATKISATGLGITDVDNPNISSATISITGNYQKGQDILSVFGTLPIGITAGAFNATTGTITLTGSASFANYTTALAQIAYANTSDSPNILSRTVSFTVNDGTTNSNTVTRTINVTAVNDAPVLGAAASGSLTYTENAAATKISFSGLEIIDADNTNISSATISITGNYQNGEDILSVIGTLPKGITAGAFNATTGTITLTGSATLANYKTALAQIAYTNNSKTPNTNARTVSFTVNDGTTNSNTVTRTIKVTDLGDPAELPSFVSSFVRTFQDAVVENPNNIQVTQENGLVELTYLGKLEINDVINSLEIRGKTTKKSFTLTNPSLIVTGTGDEREYQVSIPKINLADFLGLFADWKVYLPTDITTQISSLGDVGLVLSNQGISLTFAKDKELNLDVGKTFSNSGVINKITIGIFGSSNLKLSKLNLNLLDGVDNLELHLNGSLPGKDVDLAFSGNKTNPNNTILDYKGDSIEVKDIIDNKLLNGLTIKDPEIIISNFVSELDDLELTKGYNFIGDISFVNEETPIGKFVYKSLKIDKLKSHLTIDPFGGISFTGIVKSDYTLFSENNFTATLDNVSFGLESAIGDLKSSTLNVGAVLKLVGYDPINDNEPILSLSGGLTLDLESASGDFSLESEKDPWKNPFGLKNIEINKVAFQVGGSYSNPNFFDRFGFLADGKFGKNIDVTTAFFVDIKNPTQTGLVLTVNSKVSLLDLYRNSIYSFVVSQISQDTADLLEKGLYFLKEILDLTIVSIDSDRDGKLDPLVQLMPFDTEIAGQLYHKGFAINALVKAWNYSVPLVFHSGLSLNDIKCSLEVKEINLKALNTSFLKISGVGDSKLNLDLDLTSSELYLQGDGRIEVFGQKIAQAKFRMTSTKTIIENVVLGIPNIYILSVPSLIVDLKQFKASGSGEIKLFNQIIQSTSFTLDATSLTIQYAKQSLGPLLSVEYNNVVVNKSGASGSAKINIAGTELANGSLSLNANGFNLKGNLGVSAGDFGNIGLSVSVNVGTDVNNINASIDFDVLSQHISLVSVSLKDFTDISSLVINAAWGVVGSLPGYITDLINDGLASISSVGNYLVEAGSNLMNAAVDYFKDQFGFGQSNPINFNGGNDNNHQDGNDNKDVLFGNGGDDWLHGRLDDDLIDGGSGNDSLMGGNGKDTIFGGDGDDKIYGQNQDDKLYGWAGDDYINGDGDSNETYNGGNDFIDGGIGNDILNGGYGNDTIYGSGGNDLLEAGNGDDRLDGGDGYDILYGRNGDDTIYGSAGDDYINGLSDNDRLDGGNGNDTLYGDDGNDFVFAGNGNDLVDGQNGNDNIQGDNGNDGLYGHNGNDTLVGGAGNDKLGGWFGDDKLFGDEGNDTLSGEQDNDELHGWFGSDYLNGGDGNDTLYGQQDSDRLFGQAGNDLLDGGDGNDTLDGGSGNDILYGNTGNDSLSGGDGNDYLNGYKDSDTLDGNNGDDLLFGQQSNDILYGGDGNDSLYGEDDGKQSQTYDGSQDNDILDGGAGNDYLDGGVGKDTLYGNTGNDLLSGGDGNDYLNGYKDSDTLDGNNGDDLLFGQQSNDILYGGDGNDSLYGEDDGKQSQTYDGSQDNDILDGGAGNDYLDGGVGKDTLYGNIGNDLLSGGDGNDYLNGYKDSDTLDGNNGDDLVFGQQGNDILYGGDGNDSLYGEDNGTQGQTYDGSQDNDTLDGGAGNDYLYGGVGKDTLYGNIGNDSLSGGDGNDYLNGYKDSDTLDGNNGDDLLFGQQGNDILYGGDGNDSLYGEDDGTQNQSYDGSQDNDTLYGGNGNDVLVGGLGNDVLVGGLGADNFIFNSSNEGTNRIKDFNRLEGDKILITALNFGTGVTLQQFNFNYSTNTLFFNSQQIAILDNVTNSNFSVSQDVTLV